MSWNGPGAETACKLWVKLPRDPAGDRPRRPVPRSQWLLVSEVQAVVLGHPTPEQISDIGRALELSVPLQPLGGSMPAYAHARSAAGLVQAVARLRESHLLPIGSAAGGGGCSDGITRRRLERRSPPPPGSWRCRSRVARLEKSPRCTRPAGGRQDGHTREGGASGGSCTGAGVHSTSRRQAGSPVFHHGPSRGALPVKTAPWRYPPSSAPEGVGSAARLVGASSGISALGIA